MAGATGLEPATSGVTGRRSNQLSYAPSASTGAAIPYRSGRPALFLPPRGVKRRRRNLCCDAVIRAAPAASHVKHRRAGCAAWWAMRDSNPRPPRCKRDALPTELIAPNPLRPWPQPRGRGRVVGPAGFPSRCQLSESRSPFPGLNLGCFEAAIWIFSPVRGLRPSDAAREATENVPNPTSRTSSPPFNASAIESNTASTARLASDFLSSDLLATTSTSSFLFTGCPPEYPRPFAEPVRRTV
jgi:hypothetical protein